MVLHWHGIISLVVIGISLTIVPALAAAPAEIFTFQGLLKNTDGTLVNGQRDITLRIYDIATGGSASSSPGSSCPKGSATNCLWQENQTNIGVANGIFTITSGNQTSLNRINFTNALYLEVIVRTSGGNDQVLSPRINLTSAPFAISAMKATGTNSTSLFNLNQKGIFNATQLFVNQTDSGFTDTIVNITSTGVGTGFNVKTGSTVNNVVNITAGSLTTGSALNVESTSGSTGTRSLVKIVNDNTAATGTTVLEISQDSTGTIINTQNSTGAEVFKVVDSGLVTATQLKVNTTGTTLHGIFSGSRTITGAPAGGLFHVEVSGAEAGDSASCAITGNVGGGAGPQGAAITGIGNITSTGMSIPRLYVNITNIGAVQGAGGADTLPDPTTVNCIVFDLTSSAP